jgi:hypothetical protein
MRTRTSLAAIACAASLLFAAAPASAQVPTVTQSAQAQNLGSPLTSTRTNVAIECVAAAPGASGIGIKDCYLRGLHTGNIYRAQGSGAKPGVVDAQVGALLNILMEPYQVCMRTQVLLRDSAEFYETPLTCS